MKTLRQKIYIALAFIVSPFTLSSNALAGWELIDTSAKGTEYYVYMDQIRKSDGHIYFWEITNFGTPTKRGSRSSKSYHELKCGSLGTRILNDEYYKQRLAKGTPWSGSDKPDTNFTFAHPGSSWEFVLQAICNKF